MCFLLIRIYLNWNIIDNNQIIIIREDTWVLFFVWEVLSEMFYLILCCSM